MPEFTIELVPAHDMAVLRVKGALELTDRSVFAAQAAGLVEQEAQTIVLDMTKTSRIFSIFLGTIVDLHKSLESEGRKLVILATPKLAEMFEKISFREVLDIEIVDAKEKRRRPRYFQKKSCQAPCD